MGMACTICNHPERLKIDRALVQGKTKSGIAREHGVSAASVEHHAANHLSHQLRTAYEKKQTAENLDLLSEIEDLISRTKRIMNKAEKEDRLNVALNAIGQARGSYELLSKIAFSLHQARITELELERELSGASDPEEDKMLEVLTDSELNMLEQLNKKLEAQDPKMLVIADHKPVQEPNEYQNIDPSPNYESHGDLKGSDPEMKEEKPGMVRTKKPEDKFKISSNIHTQEIPGPGGRSRARISRKKTARQIAKRNR